MTPLPKTRYEGKLNQFAAGHEGDAPGDEEALNRALQSMAGRSKEAPEASSPDAPDD